MTELQVLENLKKRYSGIPLLMNKKNRHTLLGLCFCMREIIGDSYSYPYEAVYNRLEKEAVRYGGCVANFSYWWNCGRVRPRLKTIRAAIKTLKNEQKII